MTLVCPADEELAAAASGEAEGARVHATTCARCAAILDGQRAIHARIAALRTPARLAPRRRAELAATLLAHADRMPVAPARRGRTAAIAVALAAAAAATIVFARQPARDDDRAPVAIAPVVVTAARPPPAPPAPTTPAPAPAPAPPKPPPKPPHRTRVATAPAPLPDTGAGAFRIGWTRLHAGDFAGATEAFDHATDPVVAEDAAYWAAMAADRAGDRAGAIRRFTALVARFPDSARADDARTQLARR